MRFRVEVAATCFRSKGLNKPAQECTRKRTDRRELLCGHALDKPRLPGFVFRKYFSTSPTKSFYFLLAGACLVDCVVAKECIVLLQYFLSPNGSKKAQCVCESRCIVVFAVPAWLSLLKAVCCVVNGFVTHRMFVSPSWTGTQALKMLQQAAVEELSLKVANSGDISTARPRLPVCTPRYNGQVDVSRSNTKFSWNKPEQDDNFFYSDNDFQMRNQPISDLYVQPGA